LTVGQRSLFSKEDAGALIELPLLCAVALLVPERRWAGACYRLEKAKAMLGRFSPARIHRGLTLVYGQDYPPDLAFRAAATRSEHHVQILREATVGWKAPLRLVGQASLDEALARGKGVVLWVAHFSFNSLAAKMALGRSGYRVWHLSRPEHGFSKSAFGIRFLNPLRVGAELRYLAGRVVIDRGQPARATTAAQRLLRRSEIISITAGAWEGSRIASVDILGAELDLSVGAPGLALLSGASLLPVFTVRREGTSGIEVIIDAPIVLGAEGGREVALLAAAQEFADRMVPYVSGYPLQWRDWEKIRPLRLVRS
jgi:lauroyl/myristoyl acyltransferase